MIKKASPKKEKIVTFSFIITIFFVIVIFICGILIGYSGGYHQGTYDMAHYMFDMVGKVSIGNVTVSINETKIDNDLAQMKNITQQLIDQEIARERK